MANYNNLKADIDAVIKTNGRQEISGAALNAQLKNMITELGAGYQYMGVATPATNPGTPDANVFYFASEAGTYTNFGGKVINEGEVCALVWNGSWTKQVTGAATADKLNQLGQEIQTTMSDFLPVQYEEKSSGWQLVNLNFSAPEGETLIIKNTFGGTISVLRLKNANGTTISEISTSIAPGNDYSLTIPKGLAKIDFYTSSVGFHIILLLDIKNLSNSVSGVAADVNNVKTEIGYPNKQTLSSGWQSINYSFVSGKKYILKNTGSTTISYIEIKQGGVTKKEYTNLLSGAELVIQTTVDCDSIRTYSSGNHTYSLYDENSYYSFIAEKLNKGQIAQSIGSDESKVMSQKATTNNLQSVLVDAPSYLNGVVDFLFFKHRGATMPDIDEYTKFRISRYYKDSSFYLYLVLQIYYNGEWVNYDAVEVPSSAAPANPPKIERFKSTYGAFMVWINWDYMGSTSQSSLAVEINKRSIRYVDRMLYDKQQEIIEAQNYGAYELKDYTKHNIFVDANGNGDFTTLAAAYASITDSSYMNQYDVIVMPGVYNEVGLTPPIYTHTHAMNPNTVIITSVGLSPQDNSPVFDIIGIGCKLSNMTIISAFGYCIHLDISLGRSIFVAENLTCKKVYSGDVRNFAWKSDNNSTVIGCGSDFGGAKWVFNGCTFIDGWVACHTVPTPGSSQYADKYANQHFILKNCKLVNAIIQMISLNPENYIDYGFNVCEIVGLMTQRGCVSLDLPYYSVDGEPNVQWEIIGGNNENFNITWSDRTEETDDCWQAIALADKTICEVASSVNAVSKYQWLTVDNTVCSGNEKSTEVLGIALEDLASGSIEIQCWVGKAFRITGTDGEYGIGADGKLSASATNKIGYIYKNVFYRY